ncbi:transcriptional regulator, XRE family [Ferroglobus placidus DSM 10642]|uniref:Transcriptional regulator, XRE family n=1 Tax=Ferroglobus placidus (strain DSM 10642 / AEDII12DO) TaxID=589924 RepID=D3S299_FERPA|nr:helix-turn-helix domain-containing protein [Ferroglobus placidus]ADC66590.1 transcriptional regulator, XRE family [Ferroglobus placidus DSM 10642]
MGLKSPCEEVALKVLPMIRGELARELVERGLSKKEVAEILGVTVAAISQYTKGKRGVLKDERIRENIKDLAEEIVSGKIKGDDLSRKICEICGMIRKNAEQS